MSVRIIKNWKSVELFEMPKGSFKDNGYGRRFMSFSESKFRTEAFYAFGIFELREEPMFKNFIGNHYLDGVFTHYHKDVSPEGFVHVRCNWLIKKPLIGGNPIISNKEIHTDVGDLWLCFASKEVHATTPILNGERVVCSFGALVPEITLDFNQYQ